jgi:hypothetical protein
MELRAKGVLFLVLTMNLVWLFLDGHLAVWDFVVLMSFAAVLLGVVVLWRFERDGFLRLLDATDQEIQRLKGQQEPRGGRE